MTIRADQILLEAGAYCLDKYGTLTHRWSTIARRGEELKETFTRASTGYYTDRDGYLRLAAVDVPRPSWPYSNDSSTTRKQVVLLEEAGTNLCLRSQEFDNASWTKTRSSVSANAGTAPDGSATADRLIEDSSASTTHFALQAFTQTANAPAAWSVYALAGTRSWVALKVEDSTSTDSVQCYFNLSTGAVGTSAVAGTGALVAAYTEAMAGGWYRPVLVATVGNGRTSVRGIVFLATGDNGGSYSGDGASYATLWGAQFEDNVGQASSYIPTTSASATRNVDVLTFPLYIAPNKNVAIYHRHIERDGTPFANQRLWQVGRTDNTLARLIGFKTSTDTYSVNHFNDSTNVGQSVDVNPVVNDLIETRSLYTAATGIMQMGAAVALGSETLSSATTALTPATAFGDTVLHINGRGTGNVGRQGWIATVVATYDAGESAHSMADFRELLA